MTSPRYEDLEAADRAWSRGSPREAVERLDRIIRHSDDTDRRLRAVELLGEFGAAMRTGRRDIPSMADPGAEGTALTAVGVPVLIQALGDPDERIRLRACTALRMIGTLAAAAIPPLRALERASDPLLQTFAQRALRKIQPA